MNGEELKAIKNIFDDFKVEQFVPLRNTVENIAKVQGDQHTAIQLMGEKLKGVGNCEKHAVRMDNIEGMATVNRKSLWGIIGAAFFGILALLKLAWSK